MIHPAKEEGVAKSSDYYWAETKQVNSLFQLCTAPKSIEQELSAAELVSVSGLPSYLVARVCALKKKNTVHQKAIFTSSGTSLSQSDQPVALLVVQPVAALVVFFCGTS